MRAWASASSPTTMASSTITPSAMISANSDIMLMEPPSNHSTASAAIKAVGIPMATQAATRPGRNRYNRAITSTRPLRPLFTSREIRSSSSCQVSSYTCILIVGGNTGRVSSSQLSSTRAAASELPFSARCNCSSTAGRPSFSITVWLSRASWRMMAISPSCRRMRSPLSTGIVSKAWGLRRCSTERNSRVASCWAIMPAGKSRDREATRSAICSSDSPRVSRRSTGTSTLTCCSGRPRMLMRSIPRSSSSSSNRYTSWRSSLRSTSPYTSSRATGS